MTEAATAAADIKNASLSCRALGCIARKIGTAPDPGCVRDGCLSADYLPNSGMEKVLKNEPGDIVPRETVPETERAEHDPHSWPDGLYLCPTCSACGAAQFAGPKGCLLCYVCWQQGVRLHGEPASNASLSCLRDGCRARTEETDCATDGCFSAAFERGEPGSDLAAKDADWDAEIVADAERLGEGEIVRRLTGSELASMAVDTGQEDGKEQCL